MASLNPKQSISTVLNFSRPWHAAKCNRVGNSAESAKIEVVQPLDTPQFAVGNNSFVAKQQHVLCMHEVDDHDS